MTERVNRYPLALCLGSLTLYAFLAWNRDTIPGPTDAQAAGADGGFVSLFNGKDLTGWKIPEGDNGCWKVVDGLIDCNSLSQATGDKSIWTDKEYGDFELKLDWRIKETPYINPRVPIVKPDGSNKKDADGKDIQTSVPDTDSGVYLRGTSKAQVNIWCWPIGSGDVYGYRTDKKQPASVRAGVTPKVYADNDIGEWNHFDITLRGNRLTVVLNGKTVLENAELPDLPARGPIALQHHAGKKKDSDDWAGSPSLVQFRNISIKEL